MKVLLDHSVPHGLRPQFSDEHEVVTADYQGWGHYDDEELLPRAEGEFDVLVTLDTNIPHQQNLDSHDIGIVVVDIHPIVRPHLEKHMDTINAALPVAAEDQRTVVVGEDGINVLYL